ncbi:Protein phosphatase 1 regulatory subunit 3C-B [Eumeta japonica]|uniref:Protein phosphatase 1 regulatory subunit 3C-B n=1 Tax=Eumeta variegata TaxID=151549 RepID=A0A4C2AAE8_EUMVA|nr:Protein phosphatase 1 regulatory subunit 3C-B [Eumeta japonica]
MRVYHLLTCALCQSPRMYRPIEYEILEQITQGLVTPHPADQWTVDFKQPASDYLFQESHRDNCVCLENVIVKDEESIVVGTVKVKNISFEKEVIVRVTWDDWKSQQDIFCTYNKAYGPATCAHVVFDNSRSKLLCHPLLSVWNSVFVFAMASKNTGQ